MVLNEQDGQDDELHVELLCPRLRLCTRINQRRLAEAASIESAGIDIEDARQMARGRFEDALLLLATARMPVLPMRVTRRRWKAGSTAWDARSWGRRPIGGTGEYATFVPGRERVVAGIVAEFETAEMGRWRQKRVCDASDIFHDELLDPLVAREWAIDELKSRRQQLRYDVLRLFADPMDDDECEFLEAHGFAVSEYREGKYSMVWPAHEADDRRAA
jgi:hypothetical protein